MKIKNRYLKELFRRIEELEVLNRYLFDTSHSDSIEFMRATESQSVCQALFEDIDWFYQYILDNVKPEEPRLTSFFLKIIWMDDPETLFRQWSVIDSDNINLVEYSKLAYEKIKDNTIDESFMNEFKSVVKLLC